MATTTKISWCDATCNIWWGCVEVSPLCDHCYAREWAKRYDRAKWGADEPRLTIKSVWNDLRKLQRDAAAAGEVRRVFVGSMMDIFEKPMPVVDAKGERVGGITTGTLRDGFFRDVVPACPNLLFLLLTKRPANIGKYIPTEWHASPPPNVMYGTSVGTQATADQAVPALRSAPGRRFLSVEPLLERVDLSRHLDGVEWVIVGGESGRRARPMHPAWPRLIRDQCAAAGVAYHFKQHGEYVQDHPNAADGELSEDLWLKPDGRVMADTEAVGPGFVPMVRVGVKAAGRLLDGRTHDDVPTIAAVPA